MIILPGDWSLYNAEIIQRCEKLIEVGIWSGITKIRLNSWLNNFKSDKEVYFAACILDSLIYRSNDQTVALSRQMLQRTVHDIDKVKKIPVTINDWEVDLSVEKLVRTRLDPKVRFVPVCKSNDSPHKSGYFISRMYKRDIRIHPSLFINHNQIEEHRRCGIETFIFIDDFLASGQQFIEFWHDENLSTICDGAYIAYLPLVAHEKGINAIAREFPAIVVSAVEILDAEHGVFSSGTNYFGEENAPEKVKLFYYDLLERKRLPKKKSKRLW